MKREVKRLADETFDLAIVGGGVYGLSAAWDAAQRGLSVALIEKDDFGEHTSAASLKLIHGGLRYLQHLNFARMRVSILERRRMLKIAPHLVSPLAFVIPCYGWAMKGPAVMGAALLVNDGFSFDRNRGLPPDRRIPSGRLISREACLQRVPGIRAEGLTGGAVFYDAQMYNAERLTLAFGLSADAAGAALANHVEAVGFERAGRRIEAVRARDRFTGDTFPIRCRFVLNMTGPWSDITDALLEKPDPERTVVRSKGVQLVMRSFDNGWAFPIESRQKDATAVIRRGGRNYFVTPWRGHSLVGTTDTLYKGEPDAFRITESDIRTFVDELADLFPAAELRREDVRFWIGGMRPVGDEDTNPEIAKASHRYRLVDHATTHGVDNLMSVVGVKYTICRHIAQRTVDAVAKRLGGRFRRCRTAETPLVGGDIEGFEPFLKNALAESPFSAEVTERLARNHGTSWTVFRDAARGDPKAASCLPGTAVLAEEVRRAVREEAACTLADVVFRRTDLGTLGHPGAAALDACASVMAEAAGWTDGRAAEERASVEAAYRPPLG